MLLSSRTRISLGCRRYQGCLGELEYGNGMLARYARELIEEVIEWMAGFEIVDKGLYGNTCTSENGRSAEAVGRTRDQRVWQYGHVDSPEQGLAKYTPPTSG